MNLFDIDNEKLMSALFNGFLLTFLGFEWQGLLKYGFVSSIFLSGLFRFFNLSLITYFLKIYMSLKDILKVCVVYVLFSCIEYYFMSKSIVDNVATFKMDFQTFVIIDFFAIMFLWMRFLLTRERWQ